MAGNLCPPRVLSVAGSDSGGGAGIQADLKTFQAYDCFGMSVITALTAQNSQGVRDIYPVPAEFVKLQMEAVFEDIGVEALKCGMLANGRVIESVAGVLARYPTPPLVLDTVFLSKSGHCLLEDSAVKALVELLFPRALLVTPNTVEAERLVGFAVTDTDSMAAAGRQILNLGAGAVLVKGGHLKGDTLIDILVRPPGRVRVFQGRRIETPHTHGTGCTLSAAVTAGLARGLDLESAVARAREYVIRGIEKAHPTGKGCGTLRHLPFEAGA